MGEGKKIEGQARRLGCFFLVLIGSFGHGHVGMRRSTKMRLNRETGSEYFCRNSIGDATSLPGGKKCV